MAINLVYPGPPALAFPSSGGTVTMKAILGGPAGPVGPAGPNGAAGAPGGSDASFAGWVNDTTPSLTRQAILNAMPNSAAAQRDHARALRAFHVALANAATTAVDVLVGPGDSIVEGATLSGGFDDAWPKTYPRVLQSRLRRAYQPSGIDGGEGYMGIGGGVYLGGGRVFLTNTNATARSDYGLGRKSYTVQPGNALNIVTPGSTSVWILYTKGPGLGKISYTVNGGAATVVDTAAASVSHAKIQITGLNPGGNDTIVATVTDADVIIEGVSFFNEDETKGIRVWEGGHSGYTANDFDTSQLWADSLVNIPNLKLVVLSIGRNDQFFGRTPAQLKTSLQNLIALIRSKVSTDPSFILVSYFKQNQDPPGSSAPWADYVAKYQEVADADSKVTMVDIEPLFGPDPGIGSDTRDGLLSSDYVHPSPAGYEAIGDYIAGAVLPKGRVADGWVKPDAATKQLHADYAGEGGDYLALGNFSGTLQLQTAAKQSYTLTATGDVTVAAGFTPPVTAGKTASILLRIQQDGTGGRKLITNLAIASRGGPLLDPRPGAVTDVKLLWDGSTWWVHSYNPRSAPTAQVITSGLPASLNFASYDAANDTMWRLTLQQNTTITASLMPAVVAGQTYVVRMVFIQDATGSRTLTFSGFKRAGGTSPVLSTAANAQDLLEFVYDGASWWVRSVALNGS